MKRAVLINGINAPSDRGDVQERTLPLEPERIPKKSRRAENAMWAEFDKHHPAILGAVFDYLSGAIKIGETLVFDELPRLADWAEYAAAVYEHGGTAWRSFRRIGPRSGVSRTRARSRVRRWLKRSSRS
jgi:hypothetical protein